MNVFDVEATLPHGFHDAVLERIHINYTDCVADLTLQLWIGLVDPLPARVGREPVMRRALLSLAGLVYAMIDPPRTSASPAGGINVESAVESNGNLSGVPEGCFRFRLFASDWNSSIEVVARDARLQWIEAEESEWSSARRR